MALSTIFRPRWQSSNPQARAKAAARLNDQRLLSDLAENDPSEDVRLVAVTKLDDQRALMGIAKRTPYERVGLEALNRMTSDHLYEVAIGAQLDAVFGATLVRIERIGDLKTIAEVARMHLKPSRALWAAHRFIFAGGSGLALADSPHETVRLVAIEKIDGPDRLADIALTDTDPQVRSAAVGKVEDQQILARVLSTESDESVLLAALERTTDPSTIERLAREGGSGEVRCSAIRKLPAQAPLLAVAATDADPKVRASAVSRLDDLESVAAIAESDSIPEVRSAAVRRLIYLNSKDDVPQDAKYRANTVINDLSANDRDRNVRYTAITDCTDTMIIKMAAMYDVDRSLREVAISRLSDTTTLREISREHSDASTRREAERRLRNLGDTLARGRFEHQKTLDREVAQEAALKNRLWELVEASLRRHIENAKIKIHNPVMTLLFDRILDDVIPLKEYIINNMSETIKTGKTLWYTRSSNVLYTQIDTVKYSLETPYKYYQELHRGGYMGLLTDIKQLAANSKTVCYISLKAYAVASGEINIL